ncbi:unnamed protein product [Ilex paraguariensis]|uniref:HTH myb-type domain-containing protein n=1 Tax=Ilex paraguariensis TaxID=185542 RepID=A0ABC8TAH9_9AQUA
MGTIDLNSVFVPKTIADILTEVSMVDDTSKKLSKLNDYVHALQDELKKIDAFICQLPLCMHLLNDAIERLKEETMHCMEANAQPVTEPLKGNSKEDGGVEASSDSDDKKNWMSSVQLWTAPLDYENSDIKRRDRSSNLKSRNEEEKGSAKNSHQLCNKRNRGKASVLPLKKHKEISSSLDGLSLSIPVTKMNGSIDLNLNCFDSSHSNPQQKKQRRCWSPELHRRFVNALHELGGAQAATPRQIRDLMQVDDLTNDEVKSHLQKYRLHVRRIPIYLAAPSNGFSMDQDWCEGHQYSSPEGPLHLAGSSKGVSFTGGDSMEEVEDEKSVDNAV